MLEFFPASNLEKIEQKKTPTCSSVAPSGIQSDVWFSQVPAKTASPKQPPPASGKIIQEYDTPLHKTSATHNNAHAPSLHLQSTIFYRPYLPSLPFSSQIYNVAGTV